MSPDRAKTSRPFKQMYQTTDPAIWRTRGGAALKIAEMESGHLLNVVRWLRRQAAEYSLEVSSGKISADALLQKAVPQYPTMLAELARREEDAPPPYVDVNKARRAMARQRKLAGAKSPRSVAADAYARFAELIFDQ